MDKQLRNFFMKLDDGYKILNIMPCDKREMNKKQKILDGTLSDVFGKNNVECYIEPIVYDDIYFLVDRNGEEVVRFEYNATELYSNDIGKMVNSSVTIVVMNSKPKDLSNRWNQSIYIPYVKKMIEKLKPEKIEGMTYAIDTEGKYYIGIDEILNVPRDIVFDIVKIAFYPEPIVWCNNVNEYIKFFDCGHVTFRNGVDIKGRIGGIKYTVDTDGKKYLSEEDILEASDDIVFALVNIENTKNITHWKHNVLGDFLASNSNLQYVDRQVIFGGSVNVSNSKIRIWHNDVKVNFCGMSLDIIEFHCHVGGRIYLSYEKCKDE